MNTQTVTPETPELKSCLLCGALVARFGAWSGAHPDTGVCEECRARAKEPKDMPDIFEATTQLRSWQRQIIHGKNCFGEIADLIETIWKDRERVVMLYNKKCAEHEKAQELRAALKEYRKAFIESVGDPSITPEMKQADKRAKAALKAESNPACDKPLSNCCAARQLGELDGNMGRCSHCKEMAVFDWVEPAHAQRSDEALSAIEQKHTHLTDGRVSTKYKAAFAELGREFVALQDLFEALRKEKNEQVAEAVRMANEAHTVCSERREECEQFRVTLAELYALVNGECPSLLNEDSGGSGELDIKIKELLE